LVVHVGDLIEGLCGTPQLARRQCEEVIDLLTKADLGAPLLLTKGNHDVTGPGAVDAYQQVLLPYLAKQAGQPLTTARYAVERHDCLFVQYDCYDRESLGWLERALADRTARHVFVVVHQPIVPFQARPNWSVLIQPNRAAERTRLLNLLGKHRVIVLVGHVHRYGVVARETDAGRFVQVALCSILSAKDEKPREERTGLAAYGPDLVELEPTFQPETKPERRKLLEAEKPAIHHFEYANVAGYARFTVGDRVTVDVYTGAGERPWKTLNLSALL
jgi:3',5'-cyclic AMP phosphodiesterase CpdA